MKPLLCFSLLYIFVFAAGCGREETAPAGVDATDSPQRPKVDETAAGEANDMSTMKSAEIVPGLSRRILAAGDGATAQPGQTAVVHYTGWLYDEAAADHRGEKFDSSVDRGQHFEFTLDAGNVIRGWDQGVVGMQVGEVRELTIAPQLAYGERGYPDVIPPDSTLVFEIELAGLKAGR